MYRELQYQSVYGLAEVLQIPIISNGHAPHGPAHWPSSVMAHYENLKINIRVYKVKGKVFPYSLPSVGPGADPGVQAVSPQVT